MRMILPDNPIYKTLEDITNQAISDNIPNIEKRVITCKTPGKMWSIYSEEKGELYIVYGFDLTSSQNGYDELLSKIKDDKYIADIKNKKYQVKYLKEGNEKFVGWIVCRLVDFKT